MSGSQALLAALKMPEDVWEAAEAEREAQMRERQLEFDYVTKWLPAWRLWGRTDPGYERYLTEDPVL